MTARPLNYRLSARPIQLPQFSIIGLLLVITAIAITLGLQRSVGTYALTAAVVVWLVMIAMQLGSLGSNFKLGAKLAAGLWSGIFIPVAIIGFASTTSHGLSDSRLIATLAVFWIGPFFSWSMLRYVNLPRLISAALCGSLIVTGLYSLFASPLLAVLAHPNDRSTTFEFSFGYVVIAVAAVLCGMIAAGSHFIAAREAWRQSSRRRGDWLIAVYAVVIAVGWFTLVTEVGQLLHRSTQAAKAIAVTIPQAKP